MKTRLRLEIFCAPIGGLVWPTLAGCGFGDDLSFEAFHKLPKRRRVTREYLRYFPVQWERKTSENHHRSRGKDQKLRGHTPKPGPSVRDSVLVQFSVDIQLGDSQPWLALLPGYVVEWVWPWLRFQSGHRNRRAILTLVLYRLEKHKRRITPVRRTCQM